MWPWPEPGFYGPDHVQRLTNFIHPDWHASQDIPLLVDGHLNRHRAIRGIGMVAPDVAVDAGCASGDAHHAEVSRFIRIEDSSAFQPVARRVRGFDDPHQVLEFAVEDLQDTHALLDLIRVPIPEIGRA